MSLEPQKHHRQSTRLASWDYSWAWWYYVTIVTKDRLTFLGEVENDSMVLSAIGKVAEGCWNQIPKHHPGVELDDHVIMPNHVHGIIIIGERRRDVQLNVPTKDVQEARVKNMAMSNLSPRKESLSVVVRTFKAAVTTWARKNKHGDFGWQERFHDHIIRDDEDLHRIRTYISNNPVQWALDDENPANASKSR